MIAQKISTWYYKDFAVNKVQVPKDSLHQSWCECSKSLPLKILSDYPVPFTYNSHTNRTHWCFRHHFSTLVRTETFELNLILCCLSFDTFISKWTSKLCHDCIMHPLTGSLGVPKGNGRQGLQGISIGVCIPPLQVQVKAADNNCRKAVYI